MPDEHSSQQGESRFWAGQVVECLIVADQPGGYQVSLASGNLPGFLQTENLFSSGDMVLAQFVGTREDCPILQELQSKRSGYARLRDTLLKESSLSQMKFKRATDLMVASLSGNTDEYSSDTTAVSGLLSELADRYLTGCVKAFSQQATSRSAALLHQGRVVGCIYGNKTLVEPPPTDKALALMLADAVLPQTSIFVYELPEEIAVPLSALFLGCPVDRSDTLEPVEYVEYMYDWLKRNKQTGCFAISAVQATWLTLVYQGSFVGSFCVEQQTFTTDVPYIFTNMRANPTATVEMALLSPDQVMPGADYGYSLV